MEEKKEQKIDYMLGLGEEITLADGNKYILMPLTLKDLSLLQKRNKGAGMSEDAGAEDIIFQLYLMLRKKHPDITEDGVGDLVVSSMLNPLSKNSIVPIMNKLAGMEDAPKNVQSPQISGQV